MPFNELYHEVGFDDHYEWEQRFEQARVAGTALGEAADEEAEGAPNDGAAVKRRKG